MGLNYNKLCSFLIKVGIWNPTIQNPDFVKIRIQMVWFSKAQICAQPLKTGPFESQIFLTKWQSFVWNSNSLRISDSIENRQYSGDLKSVFWIVEKRLGCKWSGFQMGSEIFDYNMLYYFHMYADPVIWVIPILG